jgi:hypothetical protein
MKYVPAKTPPDRKMYGEGVSLRASIIRKTFLKIFFYLTEENPVVYNEPDSGKNGAIKRSIAGGSMGSC